MIGTVRERNDESMILAHTADHVVALGDGDASERIRAIAPNGVDRIIEVAFSANIDLDADVAAHGCVIAAYASPDGRPSFPFWPMLFQNVTVRLLGSDDFPMEMRLEAARDLTAAAVDGALHIPITARFPLGEIAAAHEAVEGHKPSGRVLVLI